MLRILYAGSPEVASPLLEALVKSGAHTVAGVLTNPPSPAGRGGKPQPTPVAQTAESLRVGGLLDAPVLTPEKLDGAFREEVAALNCDLLVCFAYGKIFGPKFLALFPFGGINVHPSLLPLYRGASPVPAAILNRERETGISVQRLGAQMDAGNILKQTRFILDGTETSGSLLERVASEAAPLVLEVLTRLEAGTADERVQDEARATYCRTFSREDGKIDWQESAAAIEAKIRAYNPKPLAFTTCGGMILLLHEARVYAAGREKIPETAAAAAAGTVLGIDKQSGILIQTGEGILAVTRLQWQAKKAMHWKDFMNGSRNFTGSLCE